MVLTSIDLDILTGYVGSFTKLDAIYLMKK